MLLLAAAASGQQPGRQRDAQSSYEPRSAPGVGQQFLSRMAGEWEVAKTFFPRNGQPVHANGTCRQTMIQEGRFLKSEFVFGEGEHQSTGLGIIGFDTTKGIFTSVWVDSRRTQMSMRQSGDRFDGKQIVMYGRAIGDNPKGPFRSRTVSTLEDGDRKLVHRQYAIDSEGKERLMMELLMTRKGEAQPSSR
jgi:hypothetical protein